MYIPSPDFVRAKMSELNFIYKEFNPNLKFNTEFAKQYYDEYTNNNLRVFFCNKSVQIYSDGLTPFIRYSIADGLEEMRFNETNTLEAYLYTVKLRRLYQKLLPTILNYLSLYK